MGLSEPVILIDGLIAELQGGASAQKVLGLGVPAP
jgi:hypothetical protein